MRQYKLWLCALLVLLLAALGAFGAAAETTVGMSGAGSFKMEQVYVNVPELDVYFYALDGDGNSYSPIKVQAAGPGTDARGPQAGGPLCGGGQRPDLLHSGAGQQQKHRTIGVLYDAWRGAQAHQRDGRR